MKKKIGILLTILISSVAIQTQAQTKPSQAHFRCSASVLRFGTGYDLNERFVVSIPESEKDKRFVVREVVFEDIVFKANAINSRVPHVSIEMPQNIVESFISVGSAQADVSIIPKGENKKIGISCAPCTMTAGKQKNGVVACAFAGQVLVPNPQWPFTLDVK